MKIRMKLTERKTEFLLHKNQTRSIIIMKVTVIPLSFD
jgi:hypothetical protein